MDGRVQTPVNEYLRQKYKVEYIDTITEAGPIRYLAERKDDIRVKTIFERIDISISKHGSKLIAVAGHYDCLGNPVPKEEQLIQIKKSCDLLKEKYPGVEIVAVWIDENWEVDEV